MKRVSDKIKVTPKEATGWFLRDMAEAAGYMLAVSERADRLLAGYAAFRPLLTAPDPWYYAGVIALEATKVCDYFPKPIADEVLREISEQADKVIGRAGDEVSTLSFFLMGRLGIGTVLLKGKPPDSVLGKLMAILLGSEKASAAQMPDPDAYHMLRAALKLGEPVWWRVFRRKYMIALDPSSDAMVMAGAAARMSAPPRETRPLPAIFTAVKALEDVATEAAIRAMDEMSAAEMAAERAAAEAEQL